MGSPRYVKAFLYHQRRRPCTPSDLPWRSRGSRLPEEGVEEVADAAPPLPARVHERGGGGEGGSGPRSFGTSSSGNASGKVSGQADVARKPDSGSMFAIVIP